MVEKLEVSLDVGEREDILKLLKELERMGTFVLSKSRLNRLGDVSINSYDKDVYHIESSTVMVTHNSMEDGPCKGYYFDLVVYGEPSTNFYGWLREKRKKKK